jgi:hypothetical protein
MIAALLLSQVIVPAGPSTALEPATGWQCSYVAGDGTQFKLSGVFPDFPVGSPANVPLQSEIGGDGPAFLRGKKPVNSYDPENGQRKYQVSFADSKGDRYNLNFQFAERGETPADITQWISSEQRLTVYASGNCVADFNPGQKSQ